FRLRARVLPSTPQTRTGLNALLQAEAACVEATRVELLAKGLERMGHDLGEHVLDDAHLRVVPERQVDMARRDEVHGRARTCRAADGDADRAVTWREHEERRREDRPGPLPGVAEEAPRPLPRLDPAERA